MRNVRSSPALKGASAIFLLVAAFWLTRAGLDAWSGAGTPAELTTCFSSSERTHAAECLRKKTDALLARYTPAQLLTYVTLTSSPTFMQDQCHPIGHIIGERTYRSAGGLERALAMCTNACRSSCLHGAISAGVQDTLDEKSITEDIAHSDNETLKSVGARYCTESNMLCHGIGHVAMIINDSLEEALSICDAIVAGFDRESCYQGIFMERTGLSDAATPFENTIPYELHSGDYTYPCLDLAPRYRHACFQVLPEFQLPLFTSQDAQAPGARLSKAREVCETLSGVDRSYCFEGIGVESSFLGFRSYEGEELQALCDPLSRYDDRASCTLGVMPKYFFLGRYGADYCDAIAEKERQALCYRAIFKWAEGREIRRPSEAAPKLACELWRVEDSCGSSSACRAEWERYERSKTNVQDYRFGLYGPDTR